MRQSNIELLRIVSMVMVLAVHIDGASLGLPELKGNLELLNTREFWKLSVEALSIIGVNCFTLISGYFSIKFRLRSIGQYLFQCLFYSVSIYLAFIIYAEIRLPGVHLFSLQGLVDSCMILTHTDLWYVPAYFMLILLAPLINLGFDHLSVSKIRILIGIFILYNIWGGWFWGGKFNPTGYTVMQLIMMYMLGRCIASDSILNLSKLNSYFNHSTVKLRILYCTVYLLASAITFVMACYNPLSAFAYNQPFVIMSSLALFLFFREINFKPDSSISKWINYVAKSSFAVYLIHKAPLIWGNIMRPSVLYLWNTLSLSIFSCVAVAIIIVIYFMAICIDPIQRYISRMIFYRK